MNIMLAEISLFAAVVIIVLVGVGLWLLNTKVTMQQWCKTLINVLVVVAVIYWLLNITGVMGEVKSVPVPQLK